MSVNKDVTVRSSALKLLHNSFSLDKWSSVLLKYSMKHLASQSLIKSQSHVGKQAVWISPSLILFTQAEKFNSWSCLSLCGLRTFSRQTAGQKQAAAGRSAAVQTDCGATWRSYIREIKTTGCSSSQMLWCLKTEIRGFTAQINRLLKLRVNSGRHEPSEWSD